MPARTGNEYIERLREQGPDVYLHGERVKDVTTHPALRNGVNTLASLYDMQHDPALRDEMTYASPTTGDRAGMLFMSDRDIFSNKRHHFSGGSGGGLEGVIYVPNSELIFSGGSNDTSYTVLVADKINISGPSYLGGGYGGGIGGGGGSPIKAGVLVE